MQLDLLTCVCRCVCIGQRRYGNANFYPTYGKGGYAPVRNRRRPNDFGFYLHLEKPSGGGETQIDVSVGRVQRIQLVVPRARGGFKRFLCVCVCLLVCFGFFFLF